MRWALSFPQDKPCSSPWRSGQLRDGRLAALPGDLSTPRAQYHSPCSPLPSFPPRSHADPPYLAVPQQVLALTVLTAEVPGTAIQLLGDSALAGLGAVSTSDTAQAQLLSEVLFVQQHTAWKEEKRKESPETQIPKGKRPNLFKVLYLKPLSKQPLVPKTLGEMGVEHPGQKALPHGPLSRPPSLLLHSPWLGVIVSSALPHLLTFAAEAFLHSAESEFLMQEFLLPTVLTLGHHTPKPLEVLTAITAAELEHLILRWGHRAGRTSCNIWPQQGPSGRTPSDSLVVWQDVGGGGALTCQSKTSGLPLKRL